MYVFWPLRSFRKNHKNWNFLKKRVMEEKNNIEGGIRRSSVVRIHAMEVPLVKIE